jgi:hypothetical protein
MLTPVLIRTPVHGSAPNIPLIKFANDMPKTSFD